MSGTQETWTFFNANLAPSILKNTITIEATSNTVILVKFTVPINYKKKHELISLYTIIKIRQ